MFRRCILIVGIVDDSSPLEIKNWVVQSLALVLQIREGVIRHSFVWISLKLYIISLATSWSSLSSRTYTAWNVHIIYQINSLFQKFCAWLHRIKCVFYHFNKVFLCDYTILIQIYQFHKRCIFSYALEVTRNLIEIILVELIHFRLIICVVFLSNG